MIAALFDVEGTLYTNQMGRGLLLYAREHGHRGAANRYYARVLPFYLLRKLRLISDERLRQAAIGGLAGIMQGWTVEEANTAFDWIINDYILPTARPEVLARLVAHKANGDAIMLVSGMPAPCLERLGATLGALGVIGTQIELRDGRYTGRSLPPIMVGEHKGSATRRFFAGRNLDIDWPGSFAYGDSVHDRHLFDLAGHPVAVQPDAELRTLAQTQGWETIG
jgi:HAD superfamily hydrolase (TIGR01490 family)